MSDIELHTADHATDVALNPAAVAAERRAARDQMYMIKGGYYAKQSGNGVREKLRRMKQLKREIDRAQQIR